MVQRFSTKAFVIAALVHLAGTMALIDWSFALLRESKRLGVDVQSEWLTAIGWIWAPVPLALAHAFPLFMMYYGLLLLLWSVCVGVAFGFLFPHVLKRRRQTI
jgi:hypothetical protein